MKKSVLALCVLCSFAFFACEDDKGDDIKTSYVNINMKLPKVLKEKGAVMESFTVHLTNVNSGAEIKKEFSSMDQFILDVENSLYNIIVEGNVSYSTARGTGLETIKEEKVKGAKQNIEIINGLLNLNIELFLFNDTPGFVISEIFFTGTKTPDGKQYNDDKYFEIYNNSSEVLYADGLCIGETELNTASALNKYTPDIRGTATPVSAVYRIPGTGKQHPVQPGESIVICDVAMDHTTVNTKSFDLSKAAFEWFDGADVDVDIPEVPNMEKMVSTSATSWALHNRGFNSYILFKLDNSISPESFTNDNAYHYQYTFVFGTFTRVMEFDAWKVPNDLIIDAVECSTPSNFEWKALDPSLDISWTHSGDGDDARYGKSVCRKIAHTEKDGRKVLMDTNDSGSDFIPTAEPTPGIIE